MTVTLVNNRRDKTREFDTWEEAQEQKDDLVSLGASPEDFEIVKNGDGSDADERATETVEPESDTTEVELVNPDESAGETREMEYVEPIPNLPDWMVETVDHGGLDLSKDGCQVIANGLDFQVTADPDVKSHETDFEYACYTAKVVRPDGREFTAVGDCHINESGKSKVDLNRMAETRAKKRAVKWATAGGIEPFVGGPDE